MKEAFFMKKILKKIMNVSLIPLFSLLPNLEIYDHKRNISSYVLFL